MDLREKEQTALIVILFIALIGSTTIWSNNKINVLNNKITKLEKRLEENEQLIYDYADVIEQVQTQLVLFEETDEIFRDILNTDEETILGIQEIVQSKISSIPQWWIELTETSSVDLTQFNEMDPDNTIEVSPSTITWNHMDKTLERRVYTELSQTQQTELVTEFSFMINEFTNNDGVNSRIVSLWMLGETVELGVIGNRSFTQLYAEHVSNSTSRYELVLHQRVAGPNQFISVGPVLNVSQRYYVRLFVYNSSIMYQLSDSALFDGIIFESGEYLMVPRDYSYLMLSCMFVNPKDRGIWSSGSISDVKISGTR